MRSLLYLIIFLRVSYLSAQVDSLGQQIALDMITINEKVINSVEKQTLSTKGFSASLNTGDLLTSVSTAYIKSYGLGSLATLALWGGSTNQNLVEWEGIPITNPMLGLADLSLIPLGQNNNLSLTKGGCSAEHGSGAITGLLNISSNNPKLNGSELSSAFSYGSFNNTNLNLGFSHKSDNSTYNIQLFRKSATNDFRFQLGPNEKQQSNADNQAKGLTADSRINLNTRNVLGLNIWLQNAETGIPPTSTQNRSEARQFDLTKRYKLFWNHQGTSLQLSSFAAYLDEKNDYTDNLKLIFAENSFDKYLHESEAKLIKANAFYIVKYELSHSIAKSKSYNEGRQSLSTLSIYGSVKHRWNTFSMDLGIRNEWRSLASPPVIPSLQLENVFKNFKLKLKLSREYRAATLNELFWTPGGRRDLRPEQGWNQELWLTTIDNNPTRLKGKLSIFHRVVANWILWAPIDNQQFWSAYNLGEVRSYGADLEVAKQLWSKNWTHTLSGGGTYIRSENRLALSLPKIAIGDQLIYTPRIRSFINLETKKNDFSSIFYLNYTASARGINENLPSYLILNMILDYQFLIAKTTNNIGFQLNNLLNTEYRVIERRPMPGRYFLINWTINIHSKK